MLLLSCDRISKSFGDRSIFSDVSLKIHSDDRIGLVGANGAGKSTLLKILAGIERPDEGRVALYTNISYIGQQDNGISVPEALTEKDGRLSSSLSVKFGELHNNMSGGEKSRAHFAMNYDAKSGLLILDEPTSNMDMEASKIVEKTLREYQGAFILVSHDRNLLDNLCNGILEIADGNVRMFKGNYSKYVEQREEIYNRQMFEYEAYIKEKKRLFESVEERSRNAGSIRKAPKRMGNSEARLHKRAATESQEQIHKSINALKTRIEHLEKKDRPPELPDVKMSIDPPENPVASVILRAHRFSLHYPGLPIFEEVNFDVPTGKRTALIGGNGTGKSSLVERVVKNHELNLREEALTLAPRVKIGYFKQDLSNLNPNKTILENVMEKSIRPESEARTILARLLIKRDDVHKKVQIISGGEKVKVSIARILASDANFIILDEPTNYLDVFSMEALEKVLCDYTGTLLLISHDQRFIENVAHRLLIIENHKIVSFEGSFKEYENEKKKKETKNNADDSISIAMLDMRLAELSARIDSCRDERVKDELEKQYFEICKIKKRYY